jgi:hypothetical protein
LDAPTLVDGDLPNNDFDVRQEERMFKQAKMYTDHGNECFTNKEILSIRLLGIMRDIGAPLKTYRRIVVITDREPITTNFRQRHTSINHLGTHLRAGIWVARLVPLMKAEGVTGGRLFQRVLTPSKLFEFEHDFFTLNERVQSLTDFIDKNLDVRGHLKFSDSFDGVTRHRQKIWSGQVNGLI